MSDSACLTCGSEPLPTTSEKALLDHYTPCCSLRICQTCLTRNHRLKEYCVFCTSASTSLAGLSSQTQPKENDGFIIGDSDDEDDPAPPDYDAHDSTPAYSSSTAINVRDEKKASTSDEENKPEGSAALHYVQPGDTFRSLALMYGVKVSSICQANC